MKGILLNIRNINLKWSILFIILLSVINFVLFFFNRKVLLSSEDAISQVSEVEKGFEKIWDQVQGGDLGIRGYMLNPDEQMLDPLYKSVRDYETDYNTVLEILAAQQFDISKLRDFKNMLDYKIRETVSMKELIDAGKKEEALEILKKDTGYDLWLVYDKLRPEITAFENNLLGSAQAAYQKSLRDLLYIQAIIVLISVPFLFSIFLRMGKNARQRREMFLQLHKSNQEYLFSEKELTQQERLEDKKVIEKIVRNLKKATEFIQKIASGNYDATWSGMDDTNQRLNENNLAGELVKMRDQMKKVRADETRRSWTNEGIARFTQSLSRRDENIEETLGVFLSELVKYLNANQGVVFLVNNSDEGTILELKACYAYGRQKFISQTLKPGEGLAGQAYMEKDAIYLTDVPENYLKISSGLGESTPKNILITPMKYNGEVVGVLELVSFRLFEEHEIQFIRKILETLSANIISVNMNEKTKRLLEESQHQSSVMQAQEEELRQNAEELHAQHEVLQGTNEQLKRRVEELEAQLSAFQNRART